MFVKGWFGDEAFLDIDNEPIVGANETYVQPLFKFIPLAANHDSIAIAKWGGAGNHGIDQSGIKLPDALKQIANLLMFDAKLRSVIQMLVLAAATIAEISAWRFDAVWRRLNDIQEAGAGKILFDLRDFGIDGFSQGDEGDEHDEFAQPPDPFASESDIVNAQADLGARKGRGIHSGSMPRQSNSRWVPVRTSL